MEENITSLSGFSDFFKDTLKLKEVDIKSYSPLALAYIGDAVYELIVRTKVMNHGSTQVHNMHKKSARLVNAGAQAEIIRRLLEDEDLTPEEVTAYKRGRNAKAVNFGIVYGISSFGLSQDLSISRKEATAYIEQYFETYPGVKRFLDNMVERAKKDGYVTTLYGRRRPVPELASSNFMQRSFGERVAMNSPIQGTAADIMKIAMIRVWERLHEEGLQSRLILQVHDELLIETLQEEEAQVRRILEEEMKHAASLAVTLEVGMSSGHDWYESK